MGRLASVRKVWRHLRWADRELSRTIATQAGVPEEAVREMAHVLGTEETWLSRIESREAGLLVWPACVRADLGGMLDGVHTAARAYLTRLNETELDRVVTYTNSAGAKFTGLVGDILVHVGLHGQYHRGKINLLLRQAGIEPVPVDYIAWKRGVPAATEARVERLDRGGKE